MMSKGSVEIGRRAVLLLVAMVLALIVSGGAALAITKSCEANVECVGTKNADTLNGTDGQDIMYGGGRGDTLKGFGGNDYLFGQGGADKLFGGPGLDGLIGGPGPDTLSGGADSDAYFFGDGWGKESITDSATPANGVSFHKGPKEEQATVDLTIELIAGEGPEVTNASGTSTLNWESNVIADVQSGSGDDRITGNNSDNHIDADTGVDNVAGFGGDDIIDVADGSGDDMVDCGETLFNSADSDTVRYDLGDQVADDCENKQEAPAF